MRRRVMVDGKPGWTENEPGRARVQGYGGSLITHPVTSVKPRVRLPRQPLKLARSKPMCGAVLPRLQETCARTAGHREAHRSAYAVEADNARRRRIYDGFSA